jgi:hypothetical protein
MKTRLKLACAVMAVLPVFQAVAQDRSVLPVPPAPFAGTMGDTVAASKPDQQHVTPAPDGAPNVVLFMADDVGFAMSSSFGGPVPTAFTAPAFVHPAGQRS